MYSYSRRESIPQIPWLLVGEAAFRYYLALSFIYILNPYWIRVYLLQLKAGSIFFYLLFFFAALNFTILFSQEKFRKGFYQMCYSIIYPGLFPSFLLGYLFSFYHMYSPH